MLLFRSEEHIAQWLRSSGLPPGATMTLEQCRQLGKAWYHDKAGSSWRRKTLDEAQSTLAEIGLIEEFWDLSPRKTP